MPRALPCSPWRTRGSRRSFTCSTDSRRRATTAPPSPSPDGGPRRRLATGVIASRPGRRRVRPRAGAAAHGLEPELPPPRLLAAVDGRLRPPRPHPLLRPPRPEEARLDLGARGYGDGGRSGGAAFGMPATLIAAASVNGFVFGFFRIAWIIIASIYLYHVAVETGQFQVMKESIAGVSSDRRIQVILIAFCFGAFLEGTGGGGAPVAIAGSFLIGLGFPHFQAATLCLLANTAPVAWGGVGNPIRVLNGVTGLPIPELNAMVGRILPPFSFILPAWLVITMVGWKRALEVLPALVVSGGAFAAMQFYWSNYQEHDPGLVDIVAAIFSLLVMVA